MQQRKSKIVLIYFFLLISVGSINNIELNNLKISKTPIIKITGVEEKNNLLILKEVENLNLKNIFFINTNLFKDIFEKNSLIENYKISKIYPSTLEIEIKKTEFLAQITNNGKIYFVGSNGKLSENVFSKKKLPFIFGKINIDEFLLLKKIIDESKFSYQQIENLYFFPSGRWDMQLKNKILIKLAKENVKDTLNYAFDFLSNNKYPKIKIIDLRIDNKIISNE